VTSDEWRAEDLIRRSAFDVRRVVPRLVAQAGSLPFRRLSVGAALNVER